MGNLTPVLMKLNSSLIKRRRVMLSIYMTDHRSGHDVLATLSRLAPGTWVIFRHYEYSARQSLAKQAATICRRRGLVLLVAGDAYLAHCIGASGLHLPAYLLNRPSALHRYPQQIISAAVHSVAELRRAEALGVDLVLVSPIFPTGSHPGARGIGLFGLRDFCRRSSLPVVALGGINDRNRRAVAATDAVGIAAISLFEGSHAGKGMM